jgi:hypothetical protein
MLSNVSLGFPVPDPATLATPFTFIFEFAIRYQENVVLSKLLVGSYENRRLLQIDSGVSVLVRVGKGDTRTDTFSVFEHPLAVMV